MSKSAERAIKLLKVLARNEGEMGLMELSAAAGLDKSTTSRLLRSLQSEHFVHRDPHSRLYRVGAGLLALTASITKRNRVLRVVHPFLERLRDLSGESTSFYLRLGDGRVCVDGVEGRHGNFRLLPLGEAAPLTAGGTTSKVILAHQSDDEIERVLQAAGIFGSEREVWNAHLKEARRNGFFASIGERTPHVATVSAPVRTATGVVAGVTISGPEDRWTMEAMTAFAPTLKEVADDLSALLQDADFSIYWMSN